MGLLKLMSVDLQNYIRGSGLAYGAYINLDVEAGLLSFSLYRVRLIYHHIFSTLTDCLELKQHDRFRGSC
jgi:Zn-dependent M16 (insulinase) family peptidase